MKSKTNFEAIRIRRLSALLFAVVLGAISGTSVAKAQPTNDECSGAVVMTLDTFYELNTSTATVTNDPMPACQPNLSAGVWFRFAPPTNGIYVVSTCDSDFDTVLAIYTGNCVSPFPVSGGCNDNNGPVCQGPQASLVFNGVVGTAYAILVGGAGTNGHLSIVVTTPDAPIMVQSPLSQGACANEPVTFDATVYSVNAITYQWQLNGTNLAGKTTSSLTIPSVQPKDAGNYRMVATNPQGSVTSSVARLSVTSQPTIASAPKSVNATPGSIAEFNVIASGGGPYVYQWKRNGNAVGNGTTPTLLIPNVGTNNSGTYTVSIQNPCGTVQSAPVTLTIVKRALRFGNAEAGPGQLVEVPVRLLGSSNENHIVFSVLFNNSLVQLDDIILNDSINPNATLVWNNPSPGQVTVSVQLPTGQVVEKGNYDLAWLIFNVSDNVPGPGVVLLTQGNPTEIFNPSGTSLPFASGNGMILISGEGLEPPALNPGTGLFEHDFLVAAAAGGFPSDRALHLRILDLGQDSQGRPIQVFNATGISNSVPFMRIKGPLASGIIPVTIQYIVVDRQSVPNPSFQIQEIAVPQPPATPKGTPISIPADQMTMANGAAYLKFKTLPGRKYYVQYSSDAVHWNTSVPSMTGNGGWVIWIDNGPPKTPTRPGDQNARFYRAFLAD